MAEDFCGPYEECSGLDGRLLINRYVQGPVLALEQGELPLGSLNLNGMALRPYLHLSFQQRWIPREACLAPVRSVMGLAPLESITIDIRTREQVDYTSMVQHAADSSEVRTHTQREGRELVDVNYDGNTVVFGTVIGAVFGSLWETIGAVGGAALGGLLGGPLGAVAGAGLGSAIGGWLGEASDSEGASAPAGPSPSGDTLTTINETLDSVERSESQHTFTENSVSKSLVTERSITRTFANPYRDRSLMLRFIPVFRRFEIVTTLHQVHFGLAAEPGPIVFRNANFGLVHGDFLQARALDPRMESLSSVVLNLDGGEGNTQAGEAVREHLSANAPIYTRRFLTHLQQQRNLDALAQPIVTMMTRGIKDRTRRRQQAQAYAWSKIHTQGGHIYLPFTDLESLNHSRAIRGDAMAKLNASLSRTFLNPEWKQSVQTTRSVRLFMGTHVEAAPGQCVLPDVPSEVPV